MAINNTTLSGAVTAYATQFAVVSTTNITAPVLTTGAGMTWLFVENELMWVTGVPVSGTVQVSRGMLGTKAVAHLTAAPVIIGTPTDFPVFLPTLAAFAVAPNSYQGMGTAVASAATIIAPGPVFHVTGTVATNIITPPANFVEGTITIIADGVWTFTSSAVTNGIAMTGTVTTAKSAVSFTYDAATALWYPHRLA
jgi:hypothetical protein